MTNLAAAAAAKSLQSCPTLSDPMDCRLPGSCVPVVRALPGKNTEVGCRFLLQPRQPIKKQRHYFANKGLSSQSYSFSSSHVWM